MFLGVDGAVPVLQRHQVTSVWGNAPAGQQVAVFLGKARKADAGAVANASGVWTAFVPPQPAAYNVTLTVIADSGATVKAKVSFGEVVLCVGQSNMGMQVGPSVRGFDADNSTAEGGAAGRYSGRISLHSRTPP